MTDDGSRHAMDADGLTLLTLADARGLSVEFLRGLGVSDGRWQGRPAVRIGYRDERDREVTHQYRIALAGDRFRFASGAKPIPYGISRLATTNTPAWIFLVEGPSDCWTLWSHDIPAIGIPSASIWREGWTRYFDGIAVIYVVDEGDQGGRTLLATLAGSSLRDRVRVVHLDGAKDPSDLYLADPGRFVAGMDAARQAAAPLDVAQSDMAPAPTLADALATIEQFLRRYVVVARPEAMVAVVLWVAHTHALQYADATPYLAVSSPEKQSGKTRLLECLTLLAHDCASILVTPTASTIFRMLDATPDAALLLDELDAVFRDHSDKYEEVRAVINAGHRRGATVPRNVPGPRNTWVVKQFSVFGPKALAGIGKLPDTVADRAIPIRMLKRKRSEPVAKFRQRTATAEAASIVAGLVAALAAQPPAVEASVPEALSDRAGDAWEPLLAIADAAGGSWPTRARRAAAVLDAGREEDDSLGLRLLADIRFVFAARTVERISTADLIAALQSDAEGPWASERIPLTAHRLARLLRPFEIASRQMRIEAVSLKGYERLAFVDSWERYLDATLPSPTEAKHRNTDHERSFDVSAAAPSDTGGDAQAQDVPLELDYPRSAWDPEVVEGDPQADLWAGVSLAEPSGGRGT